MKKLLICLAAILLMTLLFMPGAPAAGPDDPVDFMPWRFLLADGVSWDYTAPFTYDGDPHTVAIPAAATGDLYRVKEFKNNTQTNAGKYRAEAVLISDFADPEEPEFSVYLDWEIKKADITIPGLAWDYQGSFVYDGTEKTVLLTGLPEGVTARYTNNTHVNAADAIMASAVLIGENENYNYLAPPDLRWQILKAPYDMSQAHLTPESLTYTGKEQEVTITGLPQGVTIVLTGNKGTNAGQYRAAISSILFDETNYGPPSTSGITLTWEIGKADYDLSGVKWDYNGTPFTYDGSIKNVALNGLPEGVTVTIVGGSETDAGEYTAAVESLQYDSINYNEPDMSRIALVWEIAKGTIDMSGAAWDYTGTPFAYDGNPKAVSLTGLPEGVAIDDYTGNTAEEVGTYTANAVFIWDSNNYNAPAVAPLSWEIAKGTIDMSGAAWDYTGTPFVYDGSPKSVSLTGLPAGVKVDQYTGNTKTRAGIYTAQATFTYDSAHYNAPAVAPLSWEIAKADYDLSGVRWGYEGTPFIYDGVEKSVSIAGLPAGVDVTLSGNTGVNAGQYTASIASVEYDTVNYNAPDTSGISQAWEIAKGTYDMSGAVWDYPGTPFLYDGSTKTVTVIRLPEGVTVTSCTDGSAVNVGTYTAEAAFAYDSDNYNAPSITPLFWGIDKGTIDMSGVRWNYSGSPFRFDGKQKSVALTGVPAGVTVEYTGNTAVNIGNYTASVMITEWSDHANYVRPEFPDGFGTTLSWSIQNDKVVKEDDTTLSKTTVNSEKIKFLDDTWRFDEDKKLIFPKPAEEKKVPDTLKQADILVIGREDSGLVVSTDAERIIDGHGMVCSFDVLADGAAVQLDFSQKITFVDISPKDEKLKGNGHFVGKITVPDGRERKDTGKEELGWVSGKTEKEYRLDKSDIWDLY